MSRGERPAPPGPAGQPAIRYTSMLTGSSPTYVSYNPAKLDEGARVFWEAVARIIGLHVAGVPAAPGASTETSEPTTSVWKVPR